MRRVASRGHGMGMAWHVPNVLVLLYCSCLCDDDDDDDEGKS